MGAAACLLASLISEGVFHRVRAGEAFRTKHAPSLLFLSAPETKVYEVRTPPAPPHADAEIQRRLQTMGAQSGEVQISLAWNGPNDLDLSCKEPGGERIDGYNQQSRAGGVLDLDMNSTEDSQISDRSRALLESKIGSAFSNHRSGKSDSPVENIFWGEGKAPNGHYQVFVHHFCNKSGAESTPYWIQIKTKEETKRFSGSVGRQDFALDGIDPQLVCEFDSPSLVSAPPVISPPPQSAHSPSEPSVQSYARTAFTLAYFWQSLLLAGLWGLLIGAFLPLSLVLGQKIHLKERLDFTPKLWKAFALSLTAGALCMIGAQATMTALTITFPVALYPICHLTGWLIFGGLFCLIVQPLIPNTPRVPCFVVGLVFAGVAPALCQKTSGDANETLVRIASALLLGAGIGALIALPERELAPQNPLPLPRKRDPLAKKPYLAGSSKGGSVGRLRTKPDNWEL